MDLFFTLLIVALGYLTLGFTVFYTVYILIKRLLRKGPIRPGEFSESNKASSDEEP